MSSRTLIGFDLTRDDIPPRPGFDAQRDTPYSADMAHEDLRVPRNGEHDKRFTAKVILACQMIEKANPGQVAIMTDYDTTGVTITVIPA